MFGRKTISALREQIARMNRDRQFGAELLAATARDLAAARRREERQTVRLLSAGLIPLEVVLRDFHVEYEEGGYPRVSLDLALKEPELRALEKAFWERSF